MKKISVQKFDHTGFSVSDLPKAVQFFEAVCGFELMNMAPRNSANTARLTGVKGVSLKVAYLRLGERYIELLGYSGGDTNSAGLLRQVDTGSAHLALLVDDLHSALSVIIEQGGQLIGSIIMVDAGPNAGKTICYAESGFGLAFELIQDPHPD